MFLCLYSICPDILPVRSMSPYAVCISKMTQYIVMLLEMKGFNIEVHKFYVLVVLNLILRNYMSYLRLNMHVLYM